MSTKPTYVSASGTIGEIPLTARVQRWASDYVTMGYLFFETLFAPMLDPSAFADPSRSSLTRGSGGAGRSGGSGPSSGGGGGWPRGGGGGGGVVGTEAAEGAAAVAAAAVSCRWATCKGAALSTAAEPLVDDRLFKIPLSRFLGSSEPLFSPSVAIACHAM